MTGHRDESPAPPAARPALTKGTASGERDEPVLPSVSRDEVDVGWGDDPDPRDEDWYRRERPPHHEQ